MDKIKNILNPGHKDDEATMYGSAAEKAHADRQNSTIADDRQAATNAESHQNAPMEESGVLRQILNPNHDKYNEEQYGPAGTTTAQTELPPTVGGDQTLYTKPSAEKKEHGILRQILNPGGTRYDDVAFGQTATTEPPKQDLYTSPQAIEADKHGVLRQILNPGGDKYDPLQYQTMATNNPAALEGDLSTHTSPPVTKGSEVDPHHTGRDAGLAAGAGAVGATSLAHREKSSTTSGTDGLQVVNTAAGPRVPGSSITAPGLAAAAVNDGTTDDSSLAAGHHTTAGTTGLSSGSTSNTTDTPIRTVDTALGSRVPGSSITAPGLASAATADGAEFDGNTTGATGSSVQRPGDLPPIPATGGEFLSGSDPTTGTTGTSSTSGLNDGRAGLAGAAGAATGLAAYTTHEHAGHQHNYDGPALASNNGTEGHAPGGPHITRIANILDPQLGSSSGTSTTSGLGSTAGTGTTTGPTSGLASSGLGSPGATVGDSSLTGNSTGPAKNTVGPHSSDVLNVLDPRVRPDFSSSSNAGTGAAATGAAAQQTAGGSNYSAAPVSGERGLSSGTANPYSSTALDPRVDGGQAGPGTSVGKSDTHHGRDAAIGAGAVGAAGLGAHEVDKHHGEGVGSEKALGTQDPSVHHGGKEHEHHHGFPHRQQHEDRPAPRDTPSMFRTDVGDAPAPNPTGGATIGTASGQTATVPSAGNAASTTTGEKMSSGVAQEHKHAQELDEARSAEAEKAHHGEHEGEKKESFIHKLLHRHKDESH